LLADNMDSAIKDFSRAIELDANSYTAYQGRGLANGMAGATDDAFSDLNRAIDLDPRSPVAFAFRAFVYKQTGSLDIASKDVETALKLDPKSPEALWVRGEIAEVKGQADTAIADLRHVLKVRPEWKFAADALSRLGAPVDDVEDKPLASLDIERWHVVQHGKNYFALSDDYPQLRIPLEMTGDGLPKLLAWEVKESPYSGYGVLRFSGGRVAGKNGPEETELAAIVDLRARKLMGIEPQRRGEKVATWAWNGDRLEVTAVDGVIDAYQLRPAAVAVVGQGGRRDRYDDRGEAWPSWNNPFGAPSSYNDRPQRRHRKSKTIFDFLFGN
jgi:Tfp pilus assembly protein PilF